MIIIKWNHKSGILDVTIKKNTTIQEFIKFFNIIKKNNSYSRCLSIHLMAPEGFENITFSNLSHISNGIKQATAKYDHINFAFTVINKREEQLSFHLKNLISQYNCQIETFQCFKGALRWLRRNQQYNVHPVVIHKKAG